MRMNKARTARVPPMVTVQTVLAPEQLPLQPPKRKPEAGTARRVTALLGVKPALQTLPQAMPAGVELTVPVPLLLTVSVCFGAKTAFTVFAALSVTEQVRAAPVQAPVQPMKAELEAGVAVRVTTALPANWAEQVDPQAMPAGDDTTVPEPDRVTVSVTRAGVKTAVVDFAADIATVQVRAKPAQAPVQPEKTLLAAGVAVSVTLVPTGNGATQVAPQEMPAGEDVTDPVPAPERATVKFAVLRVKVAETLRAAVMVTVQVDAVPVQAPLQPAKLLPDAGTAVRVTDVPLTKSAPQVVPQAMPAGAEVTVPAPLPSLTTLNGRCRSVKVAVTERGAVMVTVQDPVPEQAPVQPAKVESSSAVAVRTTEVP